MRYWSGQTDEIAGDNVYYENGNLNIYTWASNSAKTSKKRTLGITCTCTGARIN